MVTKTENFFRMATIGGLTEEEAYERTYSTTGRKSLMTQLAKKRKGNPELFEKIREYKQSIFEQAKEAQREAVVDRAVEAALTSLDKRILLARIIKGEYVFKQIVTIGNTKTEVPRQPNVYEILRAIELDNKMAGHFTRPMEEPSGTGLSFMDFLKATSAYKIENDIQQIGLENCSINNNH